MKKSLFFSFLALTCAVSGAEVKNLNESGAWREESYITMKDGGIMRVSGHRATLNTVEYPRLNVAKKYTLSGKVRIADKAARSNFGAGIVMLNDEEKALALASFKAEKDSYAVLAQPVKAGSKTIVVKAENPKIWRPVPGFKVGFDVKKDLSDMPNRNYVGDLKKVEKNADGTQLVTLTDAVKKDYPAGTLVRLQSGYGSQFRWVYYGNLGYEWQEFSVSVQGVLPKGEFNGKGFPASEELECFKVFVSCNGSSPGAVTEIKDLKLTIE